MYELVYTKAAVKGLRKIPARQGGKIRDALEAIAADPSAYNGDWKKLSGSPFWRLRVGGYRAICEIQDDLLVLLALKIGPRGDAYK